MNILQTEDMVKGFPDERLHQEAKQPSGQVPQFLLISEIQRRTDMRKRHEQQKPEPEGTIADQIMNAGQPQPPHPSQMPPRAPQQQSPLPQGEGMVPSGMNYPPMPSPNDEIAPAGMAGGGIVRLAYGGQTPTMAIPFHGETRDVNRMGYPTDQVAFEEYMGGNNAPVGQARATAGSTTNSLAFDQQGNLVQSAEIAAGSAAPKVLDDAVAAAQARPMLDYSGAFGENVPPPPQNQPPINVPFARSFGPAPDEKNVGIVGLPTQDSLLAEALTNDARSVQQTSVADTLAAAAPNFSQDIGTPPDINLSSVDSFGPIPDEKTDDMHAYMMAIAGGEEGKSAGTGDDPTVQGASDIQKQGSGKGNDPESTQTGPFDGPSMIAGHGTPYEERKKYDPEGDWYDPMVGGITNLIKARMPYTPSGDPVDQKIRELSGTPWEERVAAYQASPTGQEAAIAAGQSAQIQEEDVLGQKNLAQLKALAMGEAAPVAKEQQGPFPPDGSDPASFNGGEFAALYNRERPEMPDMADLIKEQRKAAYSNALIQLGAGVAGGSLSKGLEKAGSAMAVGNKSAREMDSRNREFQYMATNKEYDRDLEIITKAGTLDVAKARNLMMAKLRSSTNKNANMQFNQTVLRELAGTYEDNPEEGRRVIMQLALQFMPDEQKPLFEQAMLESNQGNTGINMGDYASK